MKRLCLIVAFLGCMVFCFSAGMWVRGRALAASPSVPAAGESTHPSPKDQGIAQEGQWRHLARIDVHIKPVIAAEDGVDTPDIVAALRTLPQDSEFHLRDILALSIHTQRDGHVPLERIATVDIVLKNTR